jgi:large subunit ribosomal protein L17
MKHGTRFWQKKLNRSPEHRKALLKNLTTSLVVNEKIQTTLAKAKFMARSVNLMIEDAKKGLVRRVEKKVFRKDETMPIIMEKLIPRYENRIGGYTRILRNGYRSSGSDRAPLAIVEFVDNPNDTIYRLARVQLPNMKEDLKKIQEQKYTISPVELVDPVTGEPKTVLKYDLRRGLDKKFVEKLSRKERGIKKMIAKYERSMNSYPLAREKDGVEVKMAEMNGMEKDISNLSLESSQVEVSAKETEPEIKKNDDKKGWFKWF